MKRKFVLFAALFAALALLFIACSSGGDEQQQQQQTGGNEEAKNVFFGKDGSGDGFEKIQDAKTPFHLTEEYVRIIFDPLGKDFQKLRVKFTLSNSSNVMQFCAYDGIGTMGADGSNMYLDYTDTISWESDPAVVFVEAWGTHDGAFEKSTMKGICFNIDAWKDGIDLTLNEVTFIGVGKSSEPDDGDGDGDGETENPNPAGVDPAGAAWYLGTTEGGALKAVDNKWIFTGSEGYAYVYFNPNTNLKTVKIEFTVNPSVSVIRQAVYVGSGTWGWGDGAYTSGSELDLSGGSAWGATSLDKATMKGVCLKIEGATTFTLTNVTIVTN
ncbi:MAG: hypothetical protein LBI04_12450 [Treponema sp.]|nr:hypothetical protein [Treponema sp.]